MSASNSTKSNLRPDGTPQTTRQPQKEPPPPHPRPNKRGPRRRPHVPREPDLADAVAQLRLAKNRKGELVLDHLVDLPPAVRPAPRRRRGSGGTARAEVGPRLSGMSFINANHKLVLFPHRSYPELLADPDNTPEPSDVARIIMPSGAATCPICLCDSPVAPRMLKCGHVFCFPCLLRFMASEHPSDEEHTEFPSGVRTKYKRCPLCAEHVRRADAMAVMFVPYDDRFDLPKPGGDVQLRLMCRPSGSLFPFPVAGPRWRMRGGFPVWNEEALPYARLMLATKAFVVGQFEAEKAELQALQLQDAELYGDAGSEIGVCVAEIESALIKAEQDGNLLVYPESGISGRSEGENSENSANSEFSGPEFSKPGNLYFYQAATNAATRFFLSPLDIRVLKAAFGSFHLFPPILRVNVESVHYGSAVTAELVKTSRYLGFLPMGTELAFLDCDWRPGDESGVPPAVPSEVYVTFSEQLDARRRRVAARNRREEARRQKAEAEAHSKTLEFYQRENGSFIAQEAPPPLTEWEELPDSGRRKAGSGAGSGASVRTVWGTKIPAAAPISAPEDTEAESWVDAEALVRAMAESESDAGDGNKNRRGRKKKLVLLSTGGR